MTKKTILIALMALVFAAPVIAAEKPVPAPKKPDFSMPKLKFETVEKPCMDFIDNRSDNRAPRGVTYLARFNLVGLNTNGLSFLDGWSKRDGGNHKKFYFLRGLEGKILSTSSGKKLSSKQKELLSNGYGITASKNDSEVTSLYALGVDKEQAKNTAIAFLEYLTESAEEKYRDGEKGLRRSEEYYQKATKEKEGYPEKFKAAKEKYEKQKRHTHYQNVEAASRAIERMNMIMETEGIKEKVLRAKSRALAQALDREEAIEAGTAPEKYNRQPIAMKLEELRIDLDINHAEVEATLMEADKIRRGAEDFIEYLTEFQGIKDQRQSIFVKAENAKSIFLRLKKKMDNPSKDMLPPKVIDNKVVLQPVSVPHEGD